MWKVGIEIRKDVTATMLRKKARTEKEGRVAARMLAIASVLDGVDRDTAARAAGMTRQTLRDWVRRYNEESFAGLRDRPKGHPKRALTAQQEQEVDALVAKAPTGTLVRWRRKDIQAEIEKRYGVTLHEVSVGRLLRRLGFVRLTTRPINPKNDPETIETFKKTSPPRLRKSSPPMPKAKPSSSGSKTKRVLDKKAR